jgi:ubiquinone biosynthesis protein
MGTLNTSDRSYLAENLMAFFERDYYRVAKLHVKSGWVPAGTRVEDFETAIRTVCEPLFDRPLKDISCAQILLRLFQTAQRFHMNLQPQLVLLQKTLLNVEGLGRQLYPEIDFWETVKPCLKKWLKQQTSVSTAFHKLRQQLPCLIEKLPDLPEMMYEALYKLQNSAHVPPPPALQNTTPSRRGAGYFAAGLITGALALIILDYFSR